MKIRGKCERAIYRIQGCVAQEKIVAEEKLSPGRLGDGGRYAEQVYGEEKFGGQER